MKNRFREALESNNLVDMRKIPKGDLHNHITRGGNKRYIEEWAGVKIPSCPPLKDLNEMNKWNGQYIKPLLPGRLGYEKRIEAAFIQAKSDGIKVLSMSVGMGEESHYDASGNSGDSGDPGDAIEALVANLKRIHHTYAPEITFIPEIALLTSMPISQAKERLERFLEHDYFRSIDLYGDEYEVPNFKSVYRLAKDKGLILKAHVGEFGSADLVKRAVEELELQQVQHGIAAAKSKPIMNWLHKHKIQLNLCPTSNIILGRVKNYKDHPIRTLYDHGVITTINTDDMLIFDQSVSEEYFNLYHSGALDSSTLDEIRENSLAL